MARLRRDSADLDPDVPIVVPPNGRFCTPTRTDGARMR